MASDLSQEFLQTKVFIANCMEEFTPNKIAFQSTKVERVPANKTHRHVFVPVTLTLTIDPMTLIYELNLIIVKS